MAPLKVNQSAASSDQPTGKTPEGAESQAIMIRVYPVPIGRASQVPVVSGASGSFAPSSGNMKPLIKEEITFTRDLILIIDTKFYVFEVKKQLEDNQNYQNIRSV